MFVRVVLWDDTSLRAVLAAQPLLNVFLTSFAQFSCLHWTIYEPQSIWACLKVPEEYLSTSFLHFPTRCARYIILFCQHFYYETLMMNYCLVVVYKHIQYEHAVQYQLTMLAFRTDYCLLDFKLFSTIKLN